MEGTGSNIFQIQSFGSRITFYLPDQNDHIPRQIIQTGAFYEQKMLEEIGPLIPDDGLVIDAGANIGNHTIFFGKILGARVIAFEPNRETFRILEKNTALNDLSARVELHRAALGGHEGRGRVVEIDTRNRGMDRIVSDAEGDVAIVCLDEVVADRFVHLIKIDVEGMEAEVLRGASSILQRCNPHIIAEAATVQELVRIEEMLRPLGYRKLKRFNHTPTYLFKKIEVLDKPEFSVLETIPNHILQDLPQTEGIYAGMATIAGNEVALRAAVTSILPQVDSLFVYLNGFDNMPAFLRDNEKVSCYVDRDGTKYGDAGKFWGLTQIKNSIYFTCDDDIIYPQDFVQRMIAELAHCGGNGVVALHGSILLAPNHGYYDEGSRLVFHFEHALPRRRTVHIAGTGACAFHTGIVRVGLTDFKVPNMADIWLAEYLQKNGLPAYVAPHAAGWLVPIKVNRLTIYEQSQRGSNSFYDNSKPLSEVLARMQPISLLRGAPSSTMIILDMEDGVDVAGFLTSVDLGERDPIILVVCSSVDRETRMSMVRRGLRSEVHFFDRSGEFDTRYPALLSEFRGDVKAWRIRRNMICERFAVIDPSGWLTKMLAHDTPAE